MIGLESLAGNEATIRDRLAGALAAQDGFDRTFRLFDDYRSKAFDLIEAWRRNPREPSNEIEALCQQLVDNDAAIITEREKRRAARAAMAAASAPPADDPNLVTIVIKDEATGKRFRLTVPRDQLEPFVAR